MNVELPVQTNLIDALIENRLERGQRDYVYFLVGRCAAWETEFRIRVARATAALVNCAHNGAKASLQHRVLAAHAYGRLAEQ